ncbi:UNVERIFIED_ORG: putative membrane protein [Rhizobium aethiopicum]|uniref:DUF2189 domain-containing protein n=1 Tax=unclassified Rhizobium TaxID=2613769 RepID=UPI0008D8E277|nr:MULTISPECIES: DUF2189 domain-containing protein [unclassified Rhizobium]OHV21646.1 hypothetical protein BBJ66_08810 [Rhizobium sp. RSm-3]RVU11498.1 DUF2189 domain-containing protein [Rhizobium sp. RMa-01]
MAQDDKSGRYLSEVSGIEETRNAKWQRHLPVGVPFDWLRQGWRDLVRQPFTSLAYGFVVFLIAFGTVLTLFRSGLDYLLFPALAGLLIVAPLFAAGLYIKSRTLADGGRVTLRAMLGVRPLAGKQVFFTGMVLCMLMLLWMRAAVIIYALFFGVNPFPGLNGVTRLLLTTPEGWGMLVVGFSVGALFAGFAFAISVFSIPMLLDERVDAFTAMGVSAAMVWNNMQPLMVWGAIVLVLFAASVLTGFVGLIVVFPLLGHATWHAYKAVR